MTPRERLVAAVRGGEVDRKPGVALAGVACPGADAVCGRVDEFEGGDQVFLVTVDGVLARARETRAELFESLEADPAGGESFLESVAEDVRRDFEAALGSGADGVCYRIVGASPSVATPMEYGGHILEIDRALLGEVSEARFNLALIEDEEEPYVDFLSDLPCHALGWKAKSGVSLGEIREMRSGALAMDDFEADVVLITPELAREWPTVLEAHA